MIWNSHSVRNKILELSNFIQSNNIDIAFISESWLEEKDSFFIPNFNVYRADRKNGGSLILIKSNIQHSALVRYHFNYAEAVTLKVMLNNHCVNLSSIYISPAATRKQSEAFFSKILSISGEHVIAGDFNCRHLAWNNSCNSHKGIDLLRLVGLHKFEVLVPDRPTHIAYHGEVSTIDFALNKSNLIFSDLSTVNDLSSDHLPVCFSLKSNSRNSFYTNHFNFAKAKWRSLRRYIDTEIRIGCFGLNSPPEIDKSIEDLNSMIISGMKECIPFKNKDSHIKHPFSSNIQNLVKHRNYYRNLYQRTLNPAYKSSFNQLNRMIKRTITSERQINLNSKLENLTFRDNSLFMHTKSLKNRKRYLPPLISVNNTAYSDKDKADMLADTFRSVHSLSALATSRLEPVVLESVDKINSEPCLEVDNFTEEEIISALNKLKHRKAAGHDQIPNSVLKALSSLDSFVKLFTKLLNSCLSLSYFPKAWKIAKIVAIPKSTPASSNPTNFRPISLLSTAGKVFERLILLRLTSFEEDNHIFINQQFGFKSRHSTTQQVLRITEKAALAFNLNKSLGLVLLDLRKAYDAVWHDGLIHKLKKFNYPVYLIKLIASFLNDRTAFVSLNKSFSFIFQILAGVPQGSVIAPHLFNLFINDIPLPNEGELALFADDTAYFVEASSHDLKFIKSKLLNAVKTFQSFFQDWKISLNDNKTEFMIFTRSTNMIRMCQSDKIIFNNISHSWKAHVRYLGVHLDTKLLFRHHIDIVLAKAKAVAYSSLYSLLKKKSGVTSDSKLRIYKSIIRPIVTYACPIFINCAKTNFNKLQVFQNKLLRQIFEINWDDFISNESIHSQANIPSVHEFAFKLSRNFYAHCTSHNNDLIASLGQYNYDSLDFRLKHRLPKPQSLKD